jgi:hypothetical protein
MQEKKSSKAIFFRTIYHQNNMQRLEYVDVLTAENLNQLWAVQMQRHCKRGSARCNALQLLYKVQGD